jgi:hypothetical protein
MAPDTLIGIDVQGIAELQAKFAKAVPEVQDAITDEVLAYMLNVERAYPSVKFVGRKAAYPGISFTTSTGKQVFGYRSQKQFNYVMMLVSTGQAAPYHRTQGLSKGWRIIGKGKNALLLNDTPGAPFTKGDDTQANQPRMVGWKTIGQDIKQRMTEILRKADVGAKKALKKLRLQ